VGNAEYVSVAPSAALTPPVGDSTSTSHRAVLDSDGAFVVRLIREKHDYYRELAKE
jgi:hypothetical protein